MTIKGEFITGKDQHIEKLRKLFKGKINDDLYNDLNMFKRFLVARDFNIVAAEKMLEKHFNWRKIVDFEAITSNYVRPEVHRYVGWNSIGYDKDGHPVIYCPFGKVDTKGCMKCIPKNEKTKYMVNIFEEQIQKMNEQTRKLGKVVDKFVVIFDFENFSIMNATHKPTLEAISQFVVMYNDNYPERLKTCYLINASFAFTLYWSVVKNFISGRTMQKIQVFGKEGWTGALLKNIDAEVLPMFLGGTRTDPDGNPMCNTFLNHGGKVPERLYARRHSIINTLPNLQKLRIARRSNAEVTVQVSEPGSSIEWVFETKARDIGFSLLFRKSKHPDEESLELLPLHRVDAEAAAEPRVYRCEEAGIYVLLFDNSYSWLHPKDVYYNVKVKKESTD